MKKLTKKMGIHIAELINAMECAQIMLAQKDKDGSHKYDPVRWMATYNRDARELIELGIPVKLYKSAESGQEY